MRLPPIALFMTEKTPDGSHGVAEYSICQYAKNYICKNIIDSYKTYTYSFIYRNINKTSNSNSAFLSSSISPICISIFEDCFL